MNLTQMFALQVAVSGIAVSGLALLAARVLRRCATPLRYRVLFSGILGLLAIPALVALGNLAASTLLSPGEEIVKVSPEMLPALFNPEAPAEMESDVGPIVTMFVLAAWILVALVGSARLLIGLWRQHRVIVGQAWSADWWTDECRATLAGKLGLTQFPAVHLSPNVPIPMVIGLLRPRIVLPEAPASWGQQQWEAVLLHEAAHIARRDPWAMIAQALAVVLFWWCPFVHLMARRLNGLREAICDDYALDGPCDQLAYVELLVESAERLVNVPVTPVTVGLIDSARGGLEERISRLLEKEREPMKPLSFAGKLLGAMLLAVACLLIPGAAAYSQAPAKKVQIKIVIDGKEIDLTDANIAAIVEAAQAKAKATKSLHLDLILEGTGAIAAGVVNADPRIEELVRKAEAIKPGSGEAIRKALTPQTAKPGVIELKAIQSLAFHKGMLYLAAQAKPDNKRIIILSVDANGKVTQLQEGELTKLLEQKKTFEGIWEFRVEPPGKEKGKDPEKSSVRFKLVVPGDGKPVPVPFNIPLTGKTPATPKTPPTPDVTELSRQIERLNVELRDLRDRLEAQKKSAK